MLWCLYIIQVQTLLKSYGQIRKNIQTDYLWKTTNWTQQIISNYQLLITARCSDQLHTLSSIWNTRWAQHDVMAWHGMNFTDICNCNICILLSLFSLHYSTSSSCIGNTWLITPGYLPFLFHSAAYSCLFQTPWSFSSQLSNALHRDHFKMRGGSRMKVNKKNMESPTACLVSSL